MKWVVLKIKNILVKIQTYGIKGHQVALTIFSVAMHVALRTVYPGAPIFFEVYFYLIAFISLVNISFYLWGIHPPCTKIKRYAALTGATTLGFCIMALFLWTIKDFVSFFINTQEKQLAIATFYGSLAMGLYAIWNGNRSPVIRTIRLNICKKKQKKTCRLIHLSDLHLGVIHHINWAKSIVEQVNNLSPEIILITGDIFDEVHHDSASFVSILNNLKASFGVYACIGNHDVLRGHHKYINSMKTSNIVILDNSSVNVNGLEIIGINDSSVDNKADLLFQLYKSNEETPKILLSHQPIRIKKNLSHGISLQLSGHLHAGQFPPYDLLIHLFHKFAYGLKRINDSYSYTHAGTGSWDVKQRLIFPAEIVVFQISY